MFDSLKHWFDSLKEESKLFEHREDEQRMYMVTCTPSIST
jgi:hypothetical protein